MKSIRLFTTVCLLIGSMQISLAQSTTDKLVKDWERAKAYTREYLDVMPEASYSLKPTPEMRSFAEQMLHLTDANYGLTANAFGVKLSPESMGKEKSADKSKANVTKEVMASYDFVIDNIKKLPPAQFNDKIKIFDRFEMTKLASIQKAFEHQTHHRGQTTVYIRLAGVKPPQEKLF